MRADVATLDVLGACQPLQVGFVRTAAPAITDIPTFIYFLIKAPTIRWNYKFALCHPCLDLQVRLCEEGSPAHLSTGKHVGTSRKGHIKMCVMKWCAR